MTTHPALVQLSGHGGLLSLLSPYGWSRGTRKDLYLECNSFNYGTSSMSSRGKVKLGVPRRDSASTSLQPPGHLPTPSRWITNTVSPLYADVRPHPDRGSTLLCSNNKKSSTRLLIVFEGYPTATSALLSNPALWFRNRGSSVANTIYFATSGFTRRRGSGGGARILRKKELKFFRRTYGG